MGRPRIPADRAEKRCRDCGLVKPRGEWRKNARSSDGLGAYCSECSKVRDREYAAKNSERAVERARQWRLANPERHRALQRAWAERNREAEATKLREWRAANPNKVRAQKFRRRQRECLPLDPEASAYLDVIAGDPCAYCGAEATTVDHVIPLERGGSNEWDNLTPACGSCNPSKGTKPFLTWMAGRAD